ncbi:MAG: hypothetical protein ACM3US_04570 [Sphingomonadaceae bacterium]
MNTNRFPMVAVLLASGLVAGILAYTMARRPPREERGISPQMVIERAKDIGETEAARFGREFVSERVIPEMKPVLLNLLKDAEQYVDSYFKRAEKAVRSM